MKKRFKLILGFWVLTLGLSFANITNITNITLNPASPAPGQTVSLSWTYTETTNNNQPIVTGVVVSTFNTIQPGGTAGQYTVLGDNCLPELPFLTSNMGPGCQISGGKPIGTYTYTTNITIPSNLTQGMTYYVVIAMGENNIYWNPSINNVQVQNFTSFSIPLPAPYITLSKVAEGSTADIGSMVLFTINYQASNVHNMVITDVIPSNFTINTVYNGGVNSAGTITWTIAPNYITSPVSSSVQVLCTLNSGGSGTVIPNTANATSTEVNASSTALVTVTLPGLTITKSAPVSVATGAPITYVLNYTNTGTELNEYQNFDSIPNGSLPAGWTATGGTWSVQNGILDGTALPGNFPQLIDSTMTPMHDGIYTWDACVSPLDNNYFDSVFVFNANSATAPTAFYQARISSDSNDFGFAEQPSNPNAVSVPSPHGVNILAGAWYTIKIQVCGNQILGRVWPQGTAEPTGIWDINTTDSNLPGTGYAGFQANGGPVSFDNLKAFKVVGATNPVVSDVVPPNVTYQGSTNAGVYNVGTNTINWNVTTTCGSSNAISWWGLVGACGNPVTNAAMISSSSGPPPVTSNAVTTQISGCITSTFTYTLTPTQTFTPSPTQTPTFTATFQFTPTWTLSPTQTQTYTSTNTPTPSSTPTITNTSTLSPTVTMTPTITDTPTQTPVPVDVFNINLNVFQPATSAPLTVTVGYTQFPGPYALKVYNTAGEFIRDLTTTVTPASPTYLTEALPITNYVWDGKNFAGNPCASGIYIFYLVEPFDRKIKKVVLVH